ncbi:hypothetical protein [Pseudomonas kairouanensis]|uniref:hypothetical protein n=1 Tax=Pseudomonas kairouanensis TaxID=2293832 RepID=UPI0010762EE6|nr:hypothetical protein [Pseudomonas kairouanensis]
MKMLEIRGVNYKLDEFLLVFIGMVYLCARHAKPVMLGYIFIVLFYFFYGVILVYVSGLVVNYDVFFRILQVLLVIIVMSLMSDVEKTAMLDGMANWGPVFALLIVFYLVFNLDYSASILVESQQYYKDFFNGPYSFLSVHINTVGAVLLLSIYLNLLKYKVTGNTMYLLLSMFMLLPPLMLLSKGDVLAVALALVYLYFAKFRVPNLFFAFLALAAVIAAVSGDFSRFDPTREILYSTALEAFIQNPFGYGIGTESQVIFALSGVNYPAHNFLLSAAIETGVVGVAFFLALVIYSYRRNKSLLARAFLLAFVVVGSFGNVMYFYKYHFVFFMIINALFDKVYCRSVQLRSQR